MPLACARAPAPKAKPEDIPGECEAKLKKPKAEKKALKRSSRCATGFRACFPEAPAACFAMALGPVAAGQLPHGQPWVARKRLRQVLLPPSALGRSQLSKGMAATAVAARQNPKGLLGELSLARRKYRGSTLARPPPGELATQVAAGAAKEYRQQLAGKRGRPALPLLLTWSLALGQASWELKQWLA